MTWEYYVAAAALTFVVGCLCVFVAAVAFAAFGRKGGSVKAVAANIATAVSSVASAEPPSLSGAMETIESHARAAAYKAVGDKIAASRAARFEAEILESLAPKRPPGPPVAND